MSNPLPEELLSAYLDGELSPAEKADVEQRLEASPRLRAQLNALAEAGQSLRLLPEHQAPANFHDQIMAAAREVKAPRAATPPSAPARRRSLRNAAVLAATCLVAATALVSLNRMQSPEQSKLADAERSFPAEPAIAIAMQAAPAMPTESPQQVEVVSLNLDEFQQKLAQVDRQLSAGDSGSVQSEAGDTSVIVEYTVVDVMDSVDSCRRLLVQLKDVRRVSEDASISCISQGEDQLVVLDMAPQDVPTLLNGIPAISARVYEPAEEDAESDQAFAGSPVEPSVVDPFAATELGASFLAEGGAPDQNPRAQQQQYQFDEAVSRAQRPIMRNARLSALSNRQATDSVAPNETLTKTSPSPANASVASSPPNPAPSGTWAEAKRMKVFLRFMHPQEPSRVFQQK